ncbi:MAG: tetratricopeptide repeat protein [Acidobacteria bacterium]|nr:tetratricopeptide repeat protein [Acidobacteriota bacterium]
MEALDREIRSRPHGAIRAMERALGMGRNWWQDRLKGGDISLNQFIAVLDHLGLDRVSFLRQHLGKSGGFELDRPTGPVPRVVQIALRRFEALEEGPGLGEHFLETLDRQRYDDPAGALRLGEQSVELIELAQLPRLLAIIGSSFRLLLRLDEAEHVFHVGIEIASLAEDPFMPALLARRLAHVFADRADYGRALALTEQVSLVFLYAGNQVNFYRGMVDRGLWLSRLGRPYESISVLTLALDRLPKSDARYRYAAFNILGHKHREIGQLDTALEFAKKAEELSDGLGSFAASKTVWLRADIHTALGEYSEAERALRLVRDELWLSHAAEAALVTCSLVRILLLQGKATEAFAMAATTRVLVEPLRHNKIVSAIIGDLLRCGRTGLTLALVEKALSRIEGKRYKTDDRIGPVFP